MAVKPRTQTAGGTGRRRRLSHTMAPGRWSEYRRFLESARQTGYEIVSLETWVRAGAPAGASRVLILRHDVDQHPASARRMAAIEEAMDVDSTWYFRWRTADRRVVSELRGRGFAIGLHYESLTRLALERSGGGPVDSYLVEEARTLLGREIEAFQRLHGPIRSVCPHGDTRVPGVSNAALVAEVEPGSLGVDFDGNQAMRGRGLGYWLTDRSPAEGGWKDEVDPTRLFASGVSPILALVHPNNWSSGMGLWWDRLLRRLLGPPSPERPWGPLRTGSDSPPL